MVEYDKALEIVKSKISNGFIVVSSLEDNMEYEFEISPPPSDKDYVDSLYLAVNKNTGEVHGSDLKGYYEIFKPDEYDNLLKTKKTLY